MNRVILTGRLVKDVELRATASDSYITRFTLAVNESKEKTHFINCVAFDKTATFMSQYCIKGSQIGIEGRISVRNYEEKSGKKVYVTEVLVDRLENYTKTDKSNEDNTEQENGLEFKDDDIPF